MLWWLCLASKCPRWGTSMSSFAWGTFLPPPGFLCWWQEGRVPCFGQCQHGPVGPWETCDTGWDPSLCTGALAAQHTLRFWPTKTSAEAVRKWVELPLLEEIREGAAGWGRAKEEKSSPNCHSSTVTAVSTTSHGRAQTQDWRSFKLGLGVNCTSLLLLWSLRHQSPCAKCCKAKTKPSPWLQQFTALGHAITHSDEALCQELPVYKTIGYCCRWLPQQGHLGSLSKSPCEGCHRIQSTAASSLSSRLSCRRIAE